MKIKVSEATTEQLDELVAKAVGLEVKRGDSGILYTINDYTPHVYSPTQYWAQGGPIIERKKLCIDIDSAGVWLSWTKQNYDDEPRHMVSGPTPLIAAMRCLVASKLGDEVEVPNESTSM